MKIAHLAPPWIAVPPKDYGGTESLIAYLIEEQIAQGHDITLFAAGDAKTSAKLISFFPKSLIEEGVPWYAHLKAFYHLHQSLEHISASNFDIVHTHLASPGDMYLFPLLAPLTTPHITTLHSNFPFDVVQNRIGNADQLYMKWAPFLPMVAVSYSARANMPPELNCVGVVHTGLPIERFRPTRKKRENFYIWLGRFFPEKGPHVAIEAAKRANVPLVLAGTIDYHNQKSVDYFQTMIEPLIDNDKVRYVGPVNFKEKIDLLSRAYAFLNPILWEEPGAAVILETMALGCPIISFHRGVAPEFIIHGKTGFLVSTLDEMVESMPKIDEIDREMTRLHVEHNFSIQITNEKYMNIYQKIIAMRV